MKRIRDAFPESTLLLVAIVIFQTAALSVIAMLLDRWIGSASAWWIALLGVGLAVVAGLLHALRVNLRKKGTFVVIVVPVAGEDWAPVVERALRWSVRERFAFSYPLRASEVLQTGRDGSSVDWTAARDECIAMLRMVLADGIGSPVDPRRVAVAPNLPLSLAFELGASWDSRRLQVTPDSFEVVTVRGVGGADFVPHAVWTRKDLPVPDATAVALPATPDSDSATLVYRLVPTFRREAAERHDPGAVFQGADVTLPHGEEWGLDEHAVRAAEVLRAMPYGRVVDLVLAMPAAAAFVMGYRLKGLRDRIQLMEFDRVSNSYYRVAFSPTKEGSG